MKKFVFLFLSVVLIQSVSAQDPHVSQYFANPVYLNPAFTGSAGCSRIVTNVRDQWPKISGNYITGTLSYDQYVHPLRGGLGFVFVSDAAGEILFTQSVNVFYSYNIRIGKDMILKPALSVGMGHKYLEWQKLTFGDQIDPRHGFVFNTNSSLPSNLGKFYFNMGTGLLFAYKNLVTGFAVDHINRPNEGFISTSHMPLKWTLHGSYQFNIKEMATITPALIYLRQAMFSEITPSVLFTVSYFKFGVGFRYSGNNSDALFGMIGFQNKWMSIGYSYDYTVSKFNNNNTGGAHEVTTQFKFNCKNKTDKFHIPKINGF